MNQLELQDNKKLVNIQKGALGSMARHFLNEVDSARNFSPDNRGLALHLQTTEQMLVQLCNIIDLFQWREALTMMTTADKS